MAPRMIPNFDHDINTSEHTDARFDEDDEDNFYADDSTGTLLRTALPPYSSTLNSYKDITKALKIAIKICKELTKDSESALKEFQHATAKLVDVRRIATENADIQDPEARKYIEYLVVESQREFTYAEATYYLLHDMIMWHNPCNANMKKLIGCF